LISADERKTIKPASAGGQGNKSSYFLLPPANSRTAGGQKYIVQGIFFKFALGNVFSYHRLVNDTSPDHITDIHGIYGGDEYAM